MDETSWREDSQKAILLISDAEPHPLGYSFEDKVVDNRIDWREEARKAAAKMIKIDTVTITGRPWYNELSAMTNGISVPFRTGGTIFALEKQLNSGGTFEIVTGGTFESVLAGTFQTDTGGTFIPL